MLDSKWRKRIPVSPSFSVLPSSLDQIVLSLLAGRLETLKMFSLSVAVLGYAALYIMDVWLLYPDIKCEVGINFITDLVPSCKGITNVH